MKKLISFNLSSGRVLYVIFCPTYLQLCFEKWRVFTIEYRDFNELVNFKLHKINKLKHFRIKIGYNRLYISYRYSTFIIEECDILSFFKTLSKIEKYIAIM